MKLVSARVTEYQSVIDSNPIEIGDITCLVGKNEAGKTAILRALHRLNPLVGSGDYSVTDDYPRADVNDYELEVQKGKRQHATVATATFELSAEDMETACVLFGPDLFAGAAVGLSRGYENKTYRIGPKVNEAKALGHLVAQTSLTPEVAATLVPVSTVEAMREALAPAEKTSAVQQLEALINEIASANGLAQYVFDKFINPRLPKFLYFDEYYQMEGRANIEALEERKNSNTLNPSDHPLLGLIRLARLGLSELLNPARTRELKNKLEAAGNHLSKQIVKYWSQNKHLRLAFDVRPARPQDPAGMTAGTNIWGDVEDTKHRVTTELGTRSKGFVWFFSFLAWYSDQKNGNLILLLDEPGLSLHGRAQEDLLRYFEAEIKGIHQLVYSTHSPFMVDSSRFDRVRIVQDLSLETDGDLPREQSGTKVTTDVLKATSDSLFPLQGALGYDLYQTLFVGPNSLVVEGVSDLLYLQTLSGVLERSGRQGLSAHWTITPVGGSDKVPTFVALIGSKKQLNVAVLIDYQKKDKQTIDNLWKQKLLAREKVVTFADFTAADEADIEDLFDQQFYVDVVAKEYGVAGLTVATLPPHSRIVVRLEKYFEANPPAAAFNHYRPARYMAEKIASLEGSISPATLDRFEQAFQRVNALLN